MIINRYLLRLDDACPTMDAKKWQRMEDILDAYGVRPMVGVIPANADPLQMIDTPDPHFWEKVKRWKEKGWAIALHGYEHCYISEDGLNGLNPLWARSEFAGVPLDVQKKKIRGGVKILRSHGIDPQYFFAPSHTFDENTLEALCKCSDIRIISDTIATKPYRRGDFVFIPQLGGSCREMPLSGIWTFCLHPSTMDEESFNHLDSFLLHNRPKFISFGDIKYSLLSSKSLFSRLLSFLYFSRRRIKDYLNKPS